MVNDFLKEAFISIAGKSSEKLVDLLDEKKYINEFLIAKKLDITVNQTRNLLYKISDYGLVSSIRKKDKRKGWYTYFWKIEKLKSLEFLKNNLLNKIDQLNHQIKSRETKVFYVCPNCKIEFNEEKALINNFTCNECGNVLSLKDTSNDLKDYNKELTKVKNELSFIEEQLKIEKEKIEKQKLKELIKEKNKKELLKKKLKNEKKQNKKISKNTIKDNKLSKNKKFTIKKKIKPLKKTKKIIKKIKVKKSKK
jgi:transcription factor E